MNRTWAPLLNPDKLVNNFDYNTILSADLFPNDTLESISIEVAVSSQSFFETKVIFPIENYICLVIRLENTTYILEWG